MPISLFGLYAEKLFASISKSHSTDGNVVDLGGYVTNFTLDIIGDAGFGKYHGSKKNVLQKRLTSVIYRLQV